MSYYKYPLIVKIIIYKSEKMPIQRIILLFNSFLFENLMNGINIQIIPANANEKIPTTSPSIINIFAGINFKVSNMNIKYHSGLIPVGAEAKASAFNPSSHGKKIVRLSKTIKTIIHSRASCKTKFGKNGIYFFCYSTDKIKFM